MIEIKVSPLRYIRFKGVNINLEILDYIKVNVTKIVAGASLSKLEAIAGLVRYQQGKERVKAIECILDNVTPETTYIFGFVHNYQNELAEALSMKM